METYTANYYLHKGFALILGVVFLGSSLVGLVNPDSLTIMHNDHVVDTNFVNLLPFMIIGGLFTFLFIWMVRNYYRIKMNHEGISVLKFGETIEIGWNEIDKISGVNWLWKGIIYKVKQKNGKTFYFHADKPSMSLGDIFSSGFRTEMAKFIEIKKKELGI